MMADPYKNVKKSELAAENAQLKQQLEAMNSQQPIRNRALNRTPERPVQRQSRANGRPARKPMGMQNPLALPPHIDPNDGFFYRYFNEDPRSPGAEIPAALQSGYEFVPRKAPLPTDGDSTHGTSMNDGYAVPAGGGVVAYLMRIPMEYRTEDEAARQRVVDQREQAFITPSLDLGQYGAMDTQFGAEFQAQMQEENAALSARIGELESLVRQFLHNAPSDREAREMVSPEAQQEWNDLVNKNEAGTDGTVPEFSESQAGHVFSEQTDQVDNDEV